MPRNRRRRTASPIGAFGTDVIIPDKLHFRIGEVSRLAQTKPYVLRYWETEFPTLKPMKSRSGQRVYRRNDIEMVLAIKRLLYEEGFTIEGARRQLAGNHSGDAASGKPTAASTLRGVAAIKRELQGILTILSRRC